MNVELTLHEARVIGCLIEKQITTPDQYPLSLNALTSACNQRSNRDPVLDLDEASVQRVLDGLTARFLVSEQRGYGSRVSKFEHRFCNTAFGTLKFSDQELAVVCELLLRGPQTPGELRSRASRLCRFSDVAEVEAVLERLAQRDDGPFVARLGSRASASRATRSCSAARLSPRSRPSRRNRRASAAQARMPSGSSGWNSAWPSWKPRCSS
jgi:uncharacterized protein YceH (UPF0502 family)